jgi:nitrogen fixation NifU-like protein
MIFNSINKQIKLFNRLKVFKRFYDAKVIEHFEKPKNVGSFNKMDSDVGSAIIGAPACGDVMKLQIRVNAETQVIEDACFKTFGCGSAIASSSYATEHIKNKTISEALQVTNKDIAFELKLPPVKLHCSMLAEDAIKMAVDDYNKKKKF